MDSAESPRKKKRVSRWLIGCGGTGIMFTVVVTWLILQVVDYPLVTPRLDATVKAYKDAGLPWVASDVVAPVPPEQNAAIEIQEAVALCNTTAYRNNEKRLYELLKSGDTAKILPLLESRSVILDKFVAASKKPALNFYREWDSGWDVLTPEYAYLKSAAKTLVMRATIRAKSGDIEGAISDLEAINRLSILISQEPTIIALLVGIAVNSIGQTGYLKVAEVSADSTTLRKLEQSLGNNRTDYDFTRSVRGEMYVGIAVARNIKPRQLDELGWASYAPKIVYKKQNGLPEGMIMQANFVRLLEGYIVLSEKLAEYPDDLLTSVTEVDNYEQSLYKEPTKFSLRLQGQLFPMVAGSGKAIEQIKARKEMTLAMLKCLEFKNANKRFPKNLSEIGFSYIDRISSKEIVSLDSGGIFQIYTFGQNGIDEGGKFAGKPSDDYAIQFPPKPW